MFYSSSCLCLCYRCCHKGMKIFYSTFYVPFYILLIITRHVFFSFPYKKTKMSIKWYIKSGIENFHLSLSVTWRSWWWTAHQVVSTPWLRVWERSILLDQMRTTLDLTWNIINLMWGWCYYHCWSNFPFDEAIIVSQ